MSMRPPPDAGGGRRMVFSQSVPFWTRRVKAGSPAAEIPKVCFRSCERSLEDPPLQKSVVATVLARPKRPFRRTDRHTRPEERIRRDRYDSTDRFGEPLTALQTFPVAGSWTVHWQTNTLPCPGHTHREFLPMFPQTRSAAGRIDRRLDLENQVVTHRQHQHREQPAFGRTRAAPFSDRSGDQRAPWPGSEAGRATSRGRD